MLTDIFATRYLELKLWDGFAEQDRRLLVQSFRLLEEQICPYYVDSKESPAGKAFWTDLHNRISMEMGVTSLSPLVYTYGNSYTVTGMWPMNTVCQNWMLKSFEGTDDPDRFMKERLSLIELGFRMKGEEINAVNARLEADILAARLRPVRAGSIRIPGDIGDGMRAANATINAGYQAVISELNARLRQAGCKLHYHNGFIQRANDTFSTDNIEAPFWSAVAGPIWTNVDTDMKEAFDGRDTGGRDPAFYAARALESTIKIISDGKSWTRGGERGAHNFIDNLASKRAAFLIDWEADLLKTFFTKVRNPLGHGPGTQPMPSLSPEQTNWAIETVMVWIKTLVRRSGL
ncbi:MAG TPA: hypothetical protein VNO18_27165 [Xanthobacteraceae bacterium]|jgi:hypothetical protein|nr:hypothetical protein [Xanthobacteraceae bacterium]